MEVFRIGQAFFASKLTASGSPNRWNEQGQYVLYASSSRSLSTLELVVHRNAIQPKIDYKIIVISIADEDHLIKQIQTKDLPTKWRGLTEYPTLQALGSQWYKNKESLILKVPSAVIVQEYNYVINAKHPDFDRNIQLVRTEDYFWDSRLL